MYKSITVFWEAQEENEKSPRQNLMTVLEYLQSMDQNYFKSKLVFAVFNINGDNFRKKYISLNIKFQFC